MKQLLRLLTVLWTALALFCAAAALLPRSMTPDYVEIGTDPADHT